MYLKFSSLFLAFSLHSIHTNILTNFNPLSLGEWVEGAGWARNSSEKMGNWKFTMEARAPPPPCPAHPYRYSPSFYGSQSISNFNKNYKFPPNIYIYIYILVYCVYIFLNSRNEIQSSYLYKGGGGMSYLRHTLCTVIQYFVNFVPNVTKFSMQILNG